MEHIMTVFMVVIMLSFVVSIVIVKKRLFWVKSKVIGDEKAERIAELRELATEIFNEKENKTQSEDGCKVGIFKENGIITGVFVKNKRVTVKYYDEEYEYDQYDDEDMDDDNRYEKYKSKYLNDEVTYANSYNSQNNRVLSRMKEEDDDDEADIYSVMFSKINNTNIKKRKTPSERIKRNIATKNKKSKRKQKDVYSFQGTNNVFNKIFKKR